MSDAAAKPYFAHATAIIDPGAEIGAGSAIWHFCHVSTGAVLGRQCKLGQNVYVAEGVVLGERCKVQNNVSLYTGVTCGDDVFLGPSMVFTNVVNPRAAVDRRAAFAKTRVGEGATIGANATIVCGHDIGEYAFIGAGAVVTRPVLPFALVVGNPAKQLGWMSRAGERLSFQQNGMATCAHTGENYQLRAGLCKLVAIK